jgi:hypothetical protein
VEIMNALALILTVAVLVGVGHAMPVDDDAENHARRGTVACDFNEFLDRVCTTCAQRLGETHAHRVASCRYLLAAFSPVSHGISVDTHRCIIQCLPSLPSQESKEVRRAGGAGRKRRGRAERTVSRISRSNNFIWITTLYFTVNNAT